jgi:hypothetical protein
MAISFQIFQFFSHIKYTQIDEYILASLNYKRTAMDMPYSLRQTNKLIFQLIYLSSNKLTHKTKDVSPRKLNLFGAIQAQKSVIDIATSCYFISISLQAGQIGICFIHCSIMRQPISDCGEITTWCRWRRNQIDEKVGQKFLFCNNIRYKANAPPGSIIFAHKARHSMQNSR